MSDLRQAAQQALEALEYHVEQTRSIWKTSQAIDALRAALAQQTQTPCDIAEDGVCEVIDCCRNRSQILEALEIGYDSAQAEAAQYHAAMAGYRPERHAEMDANVAKIAAAITALRAALAQEEQEPVAWASKRELARIKDFDSTIYANGDFDGAVPLYTHPPRREWIGLTADDVWASNKIMAVNASLGLRIEQMMDLTRAIEAKLKERNNG